MVTLKLFFAVVTNFPFRLESYLGCEATIHFLAVISLLSARAMIGPNSKKKPQPNNVKLGKRIGETSFNRHTHTHTLAFAKAEAMIHTGNKCHTFDIHHI